MDAVGDTVLTPEVGTSPMPSMETLVASAVRHVRTTWSPAEMTLGVAVIWATGDGAGAEAGPVEGAVDAEDGGGAGFFEQPAIAIRERTSPTRRRAWNFRFKGVLLRVKSRN